MSKVLYYTTTTGENPFNGFLDSLSDRQQRKILRILTTIKVYGLNYAVPHIKKLAGTPLWEIRILGQDNIRVLYAALVNDTILVLHGFSKKSPKTPTKEIKTAIERLSDWVDK